MPTKDALTASDRDSDYVRHSSEHTTLINRLRALGAQADLDLPRIAVIGKQGAGKSSLIEAISGIPVPRDAGTCTRCPFECRMSNTPNTPWSCQVSIRWEFASDGSLAEDVREVPFGPCLTAKAGVELMLRRAQAAILNPHVDSQRFVNRSPEALNTHDANTLSYSRNVVCAELSGPELPHFTFIDLPGIVHDAPPETVQLVEDLVLSHASLNCIILCVVSMSSTEPSFLAAPRAVQLAKQVDPRGARTIGVLTKPNAIPCGANVTKGLWLGVLEGRRFPLALGYFCTRQPDENEGARQISQHEARNAESASLATTEPWSTSTQQHCLGTQKLVATINLHVSRALDKSVSALATETAKLLTLCNARLELLPQQAPSGSCLLILTLVQKFCLRVRAFVDGHLDAAALVQVSRTSYEKMKDRICNTAPLFVPHTSVVPFSMLSWELLNIDNQAESTSASTQITLAEVRHRICVSAVTRELRKNAPHAAKSSFIKDYQIEWSNIAHETANVVHASLSHVVADLLEEYFAKYQFLQSMIRVAAEKLIQTRFDLTCAQISRLVEYETMVFTQNNSYYLTAKEELLSKYREGRAYLLQHVKPASPVSAQPSAANTTRKLAKEQLAPSQTPIPALVSVAFTAGEPRCPTSFPPASGADGGQWLVPDITKENARREGREHILRWFDELCGSEAQRKERERENREREERQRAKRKLAKRKEAERIQGEEVTLEALSKLGYENLTTMDLEKLKTPYADRFDEELEVMAEVRAYFQVTYKRIIDYVPLAIDHELLFAFAKELQTHLISTLGLASVGAVERSATYLAGGPDMVAERGKMLARKKRLMSIQAELCDAGVSG